MSELNDLYTSENKRLFNLLFRHQVYLEGVKSSFAGDYKKMLTNLYKTFATYMMMSKYQQIDSFTKQELANFVRRFQEAQYQFYSHYTEELINKLRAFLNTDVSVTRSIFHNVTSLYPHEAHAGLKPTITDDEYDALSPLLQTNYKTTQTGYELEDDTNDYSGNTPMLGITATHGTDAANNLLWSRITNAPIPANGRTIQNSIAYWMAANASAVVAEINKGYANKSTTRQTLDKIVGTSSKAFTDGLFATFANQQDALVSTIIQHISSTQQAAIGSVYYSRYQWVAILDNRTTEICWNRNGTVYIYGIGPLPPAHYRCRSKDVPLAGDQPVHDIPQDYVSWLLTQPEDYLKDSLGDVLAHQVINGTIDESTFTFIGSVKPLTLEQFATKVPFILGD